MFIRDGGKSAFYIGRAGPALLSFLLCLPPPLPPEGATQLPRLPPSPSWGVKVIILLSFVSRSKARTAGIAVIVEGSSDRMSVRILPFTRLSNVSPHRFILGGTGTASRGEMEAGLPLPTPAPPTLT